MDAGDGSAGPVAAQYGALAVTWGASFLFIKIGLEGLSPGQVVLGRLLTGAVTLAVISAARRSQLPQDPATWAHLAVVAVLLCDVPFLLFAWAEQHIPSSLASIYNAATPLMTALWSLAVLPGERPTRARLAGLITGFAGVVLVLGPWHLASRSQSLAQLACLAATACYGAAFAYLRRYVSPRGIAALPAATLQVSLAAVVALALAPWTATAPVCLSPAVTGSVLALGAFGTGIAYVWNTSIVAGWGATIASTVTYVIPVVPPHPAGRSVKGDAAMAVYDTIGTSYTTTRRPDPRIGAQIAAVLSGCQSVINVGAGTGAYEPPQTVLAVDPSPVMIRQRPPGSALAGQARAGKLPVTDGAADAVMAVLTAHHWDDLEAGIGELRRVARRRVVILTWDPELTRRFWLLADYLPQVAALDSARAVPLDRLTSLLGTVRSEPVLIPHDCTDGFAPGLRNLAADLGSGRWYERHRDLMFLGQFDAGYRLLVAGQ